MMFRLDDPERKKKGKDIRMHRTITYLGENADVSAIAGVIRPSERS